MASSANNNEETTQSNTNESNAANNDAVAAQRSVQVQGLPLEWTQMGTVTSEGVPVIRYPCDVVEILPEETELCIVGTAGQKITVMGSNFSATVNPALTQLILRSHIIRKMEGLEKFTNLELLELYDNQVEALACLDSGPNGCPGSTLRVLDMSYNVIRDMAPVALCPNLQELYLANNKLKTIEGLKGLSQLRKIDLGANRIRVMEGLEGLVNLEELWLGKNKIEQIQGLEMLTKLRRLDVQSNRLTTIENLTTQRATLEELYLSHNAVTTEGASIATGLAQDFPNLTTLDLSRNRLTTTKPFGQLLGLDELWLSGNKIASFEDVKPIANLLSLDTIYLEYNPLQEDPLYRKRLAEMIPCLKQIDANMIGGYVVPGIPSATPRIAETDEERLRRLQDMAVTRAEAETRGESPSK